MTKTNNIAFQGVLGAYSHMACQAHCPDLTPLPCASFSDMIAMVQDGGADCAMVPVENSTAGRVADIHHLRIVPVRDDAIRVSAGGLHL